MKKAWDVRRYNAHPAPFSEALAKLRARYGEGLITAELERDFPGLSSLDMMKIAYVWNIFVAWMRAVSDSAWRESSQVSAAQEVSDAGI
ncbi:hypothetical protein FB107DRAFT_292901 [Schizophyllum commune]